MMNDELTIAVAKAIWAERVRFAKEQGIDLERWGETTGHRAPESGEWTVPDMNNILGEAKAAIDEYERAHG